MAGVIRTYVSANRHDVIRTYAHFGYTRQMATLYVTDNNQTKLSLTVTLTLTDTVTVIFYAHFVESHKKVALQ